MNAARVMAIGLAVLGTFMEPASAQTAPKKVTLVLNYTLSGRDAIFTYGMEKGYFKEAGFDLEIVPSQGSNFVVSVIDGGKGDFGILETSTLIQGIDKGAKVRAYQALYESTSNGLASLKPFPDVQSVLAAKIGAPAASSTRSVLPVIVKQKGLDPANIKWETVTTSSIIPLLMNGSIDAMGAALTSDMPILYKLGPAQGKRIYYTRYYDLGYDAIGAVFITSNERLANRPEEVRAFAAATAKSINGALDNPEEATKILIKRYSTMEYETTLGQLQGTSEAIRTPYAAQHGFGFVTEDRVKRTIELTKLGLEVKSDVQPSQVFALEMATRK